MSIQPFTGVEASWSPDGKSIAYLQLNVADSIDMLRVLNLKTGRIQDITRGGYFPQWSADSTRLLCAWYGGRMCIFDVDKYREDWDSTLDFVKDNNPGWNKFVWSADNKKIAFITEFRKPIDKSDPRYKEPEGWPGGIATGGNTFDEYSSLRVADLDTQSVITLAEIRVSAPWVVHRPSWSPDNQFVCVGGDTLRIFNVTTGSHSEFAGPAKWATWNPTSNLIACAQPRGEAKPSIHGPDYSIHLITPSDGKVVETIQVGIISPAYNKVPLVWSPNGELLAFQQILKPRFMRQREKLLCFYNTKTKEIVEITNEVTHDDLSWSPDSSQIAVSKGGTIHFYDIAENS